MVRGFKHERPFVMFSDGLSARGGTEDGSEEWGYVPVRPGASMFYWFYRTTHPDDYRNRPIVLWLQGGPGLSGSGLGNFLEIGPLDHNMERRNLTWIQSVNLLFLDCSVGVGFSIAENKTLIPNNTDDISLDTIEVLKVFMDEHSYFKKTPFYIFGQSYGVSLAAALAYHLDESIESGMIECNLKGIAMGNGCLSVLDPIVAWPIMLYQMSMVDYNGYVEMKQITDEISQNLTEDAEVLKMADQKVFRTHFQYAPCVSLYNIFDVAPMGLFQADDDQSINYFSLCASYNSIYGMNIHELMNGPIRKKLGVIPDDYIWTRRNIDVHWAQVNTNDAYVAKWPIIDDLLNSTDIDVIIYQSQLDIICNTAGTIAWMQKLKWPGLEHYNAAERLTLTNPFTHVPELFFKSYGHLQMYWVLNSGHAVPTDVPDMTLRMLNRILDQGDRK